MRTLGLLLPLLLLAPAPVQAQNWMQRQLPRTAVSAQYAGSIGAAAIGYHRRTQREQLDLGLLYGYLPASLGGTVHTVTFSITGEPWHLPLGERVRWTPVRGGAFVALALGPGLRVSRPPRYEPGYYWWNPGIRQHLHLGTALGYRPRSGPFSEVAAWIQANSNDLYLYSWWTNRTAFPFGDAVFLGAGIDFHLRTATRQATAP